MLRMMLVDLSFFVCEGGGSDSGLLWDPLIISGLLGLGITAAVFGKDSMFRAMPIIFCYLPMT